ncbi:MAG: nickel pincer cofactor biosynthesis protein LarC [Candidatus Brocadiia bacterium]
MRIGYLDCFSGISGDMCLGALVDAGVPLDRIEAPLSTLPLSGWSLRTERVLRAGIAATRVHVDVDDSHHHPHRGLSDVLEIIEAGDLAPEVSERSAAVFRNLAEAEAAVHDTEPDKVHFHEVGAVDAICDIVGTVAGLAELRLDVLKFSTIMLGGGTVKAAHGTLPVPAPATARLLRGLPARGGPVEVELATPTGAALLKTLGEPAPLWPSMTLETVAYGAGGRELEHHPNVLRLAVGTVPAQGSESDYVWVLETNLDDMTGEEIGYCSQRLLGEGALDVFTLPVQMKKNRPGVQLTVLCRPEDLRTLEEVLWQETSTLGVRRSLWQRTKLAREVQTVTTPWGPVRVKVARLGGEVIRRKPEYDDCRRLAEGEGLPFQRVYRAALEGNES